MIPDDVDQQEAKAGGASMSKLLGKLLIRRGNG